MAIKLIGNYAKRLGLPGYSSHQFSVSVETELNESGDIQSEATRIYHLLQDAVDREIQETGFVPGDEYGLKSNGSSPNGNGHNRIHGENEQSSGYGHPDRWSCSDKQRELILKLISENDFTQEFVEDIAQDRFGKSAHQLNRLEASGLIGELLAAAGKQKLRGRGGQ